MKLAVPFVPRKLEIFFSESDYIPMNSETIKKSMRKAEKVTVDWIKVTLDFAPSGHRMKMDSLFCCNR